MLTALIVLTTIFAFRNQYIMQRTNERIDEADVVLRNVKELWTGINLMDLGVRGYALTKTDGLLNPFDQAVRVNPLYLDSLRTFMKKRVSSIQSRC